MKRHRSFLELAQAGVVLFAFIGGSAVAQTSPPTLSATHISTGDFFDPTCSYEIPNGVQIATLKYGPHCSSSTNTTVRSGTNSLRIREFSGAVSREQAMIAADNLCSQFNLRNRSQVESGELSCSLGQKKIRMATYFRAYHEPGNDLWAPSVRAEPSDICVRMEVPVYALIPNRERFHQMACENIGKAISNAESLRSNRRSAAAPAWLQAANESLNPETTLEACRALSARLACARGNQR